MQLKFWRIVQILMTTIAIKEEIDRIITSTKMKLSVMRMAISDEDANF